MTTLRRVVLCRRGDKKQPVAKMRRLFQRDKARQTASKGGLIRGLGMPKTIPSNIRCSTGAIWRIVALIRLACCAANEGWLTLYSALS